MSKLLFASSALFLSVFTATTHANGSAATTASHAQRIIGGEDVAQGTYPWIVSVQRKTANGSFRGKIEHFCGASMIDATHVLTASHCVFDEVADEVVVRVGGINIEQQALAGTTYNVKQIIIHHDYNNFTVYNDIAILELEKPVNSPLIQTIKRVEEDTIVVGDQLTVAGWGVTKSGDFLPNATLKHVNVPLVDRNACKQAYSGFSTITENMICAGAKKGKDSCQGDSGGPLFLNQMGTFKQVGVVSFGGQTCGEEGTPGVYTRLSAYEQWIAQNTKHVSQVGQIEVGYTPVGHKLTVNASLHNKSGDVQKIFSQTSSDARTLTVGADNCADKTIASSQSCEFDLVVSPSSAGDFSAYGQSVVMNNDRQVTLRTNVMGKATGLLALNSSFTGNQKFYGSSWQDDNAGVVRSQYPDRGLGLITLPLQTVVSGPATVSFDWQSSNKLSNDIDELNFHVDGQTAKDRMGTRIESKISTNWNTIELDLAEGEHVLSWLYTLGPLENAHNQRHIKLKNFKVVGSDPVGPMPPVDEEPDPVDPTPPVDEEPDPVDPSPPSGGGSNPPVKPPSTNGSVTGGSLGLYWLFALLPILLMRFKREKF